MAVEVLVVDDERDVVRLLRIKLERAGFICLEAFDGEQGLEAALKHRPKAMLVDIMLPGMDGVEMVRRAREALGEESPVTIMVTASKDPEIRRQAEEAGAQAYFTKPFSPTEIIERLKKLLEKREAFYTKDAKKREGRDT